MPVARAGLRGARPGVEGRRTRTRRASSARASRSRSGWTRRRPPTASVGWGGDRGVLVTNGDKVAFAWRLRYDPGKTTDDRAARAFTALTRALDKTLGPAQDERRGLRLPRARRSRAARHRAQRRGHRLRPRPGDDGHRGLDQRRRLRALEEVGARDRATPLSLSSAPRGVDRVVTASRASSSARSFSGTPWCPGT